MKRDAVPQEYRADDAAPLREAFLRGYEGE